jgi:uncharacterized protein YkwD
MFLRSFTALLFAAGLTGLTPAVAQNVQEQNAEKLSTSGKGAKQDHADDFQQAVKLIIDKTNEFRRQDGKEPVKPNDQLTKTAQYFADFMARTDEYGHEADGKKPADRAKEHGYEYCIVLENIAYLYHSTGFSAQELGEKFFEGWKNSAGHRKNMLDPDVTETGVAVARSAESGYYYAVQMFGRPKSLSIQFQIANQSDSTVSYQIGEQKFDLEPRYIRMHERCRPEELVLKWPEDAKQKEETVRPAGGDKFIVERDGSAFRVKKEKVEVKKE